MVFVLAFRRAGAGATLGYLVAGAVVGPQVLGLVGEADRRWALPNWASRCCCSWSGSN
jgi:CPA2 family monovalent cation:H+ antiporter-2/glutathione-regulated potassium-efflux system protein KefB